MSSSLNPNAPEFIPRGFPTDEEIDKMVAEAEADMQEIEDLLEAEEAAEEEGDIAEWLSD